MLIWVETKLGRGPHNVADCLRSHVLHHWLQLLQALLEDCFHTAAKVGVPLQEVAVVLSCRPDIGQCCDDGADVDFVQFTAKRIIHIFHGGAESKESSVRLEATHGVYSPLLLVLDIQCDLSRAARLAYALHSTCQNIALCTSGVAQSILQQAGDAPQHGKVALASRLMSLGLVCDRPSSFHAQMSDIICVSTREADLLPVEVLWKPQPAEQCASCVRAFPANTASWIGL